MDFTLKLVESKDILPYLDHLAALRISIFREYPYLYDGDKEYEKHYLKKFSKAQDACIVLAIYEDKVVGALSGLALKAEDELIFKAWESDPDFERIYYISEILIDRTYRKMKLGSLLFKEFNQWIETKKYTKIVFATVERPDDHPLKPDTYQSPDNFWHKNGYKVAANKFSTSLGKK